MKTIIIDTPVNVEGSGSNPARNVSGEVTIFLSASNNRYGVYYHCYGRRRYILRCATGGLAALYHYCADLMRQERRYKNALVQSLTSIGSHDYSTMSVGFEGASNEMRIYSHYHDAFLTGRDL